MQDATHGRGPGAAELPTTTIGLPAAGLPGEIELADGAELDLVVAPVAKQLLDATVRMLAYNGSVPGPTLRVRQGSEVRVHVTNHGDLETTVHWHGLRLQNRFDGVPHETQPPIPVGERFSYQVQFPDPGLYWYHPHVREDYAQELGLYGNIIVLPAEADYWPPVDRDVVLTLDDILLEDGRVAPFSATETTHAAMGRFGNVMLTGGDPHPQLSATAGEVVRCWLTNTANARVFDVQLPGARLKLVGGDSGRVEHEQFISSVRLGPSERAVVDVLFDRPGTVPLQHQAQGRARALATVTVHPAGPRTAAAAAFALLRDAPELQAERRRLDSWLQAPPDKTLALVARIDEPATGDGEPSAYACPMHPEVTSDRPGHCPKCGMKLMATVGGPVSRGTAGPSVPHEHSARGRPDVTPADEPPVAAEGIEWEDDMPEVNRATTSAFVHWMIVDRTPGDDTTTIDWRFTVGDRVKIRLINEMKSDHPMHHPFHVHGAGRFLVLARDGAPEPNLAWKDTVLIPAGQTVDILLDVTNPGTWMAHCHIPEHMHSGMMFTFTVDPRS